MDEKTSRIERVPTGVPGLDVLLSGGFVKGGIYMILGMPGTGKTILANQVCFHHISGGGKALYVTLLAESHSRLMVNLSPLDFFDPTRLPESLTYLSAFSVLEEGGLSALVAMLRKEMKAHACTLLVLDGLVAAEEAAATEQEFKKFIHELQVITGLMGCTTLVLTTGKGRGLRAEHTMVDGLLVLREHVVGVRAVRELSIRKFRGSAHGRGQHMFDITDKGLVVYPRLEELVARMKVQENAVIGRHAFGIKGLDEMLRGGVPESSATMLLGSPGSGKTLLGLHFLAEGARLGQKSHYFSFYDTPTRARQQAEGIGLDIKDVCDSGLLVFSFRPPTEQVLDKLGSELVTLIRDTRVKRLFIDGFDGLSKAAVHRPRISRFMAALVNECRMHDVSLVYTVETRALFGPELRFVARGVSMITENIIFTRGTEIASEQKISISVLKLRNSDHDKTIRNLEIDNRGLRVGGVFEDLEKIFSGLAQVPARKVKRRAQTPKRRSR